MEPTEDRSAWTEGDSGETEANEAAQHFDLGNAIPPIEATEEEIVDGGLGDDEGAPVVELLGDDALEDPREIEALYGRELSRAKDKVSRWRAMQAKEAFRIGDLWTDLTKKLSADEVSAFLASECQIPRRDVARYVRLAETLGTRRQLFVEKGVAVSVLLDLAGQSEEVLDEAISMIEAGRSLQAKELRGLKRDIALARAANEGLLDTSRMRDFKNAAARTARGAATSWLASLETLTNEVILLSELDRSKSVADFERNRVLRLAKDAGELLAHLPAIAGANFVTGRGASATRLSCGGSWMKVEAALRRIAAGEVFVEVHYQRPLTTVMDFDHDLVWHLAWAFGHDEDTRPESATARMRDAGDIPLDTDAKPGRVRAEGGGRRTVLEICAGAGGQALGLDAAGFHHVGLVEIDQDAVATLRANGPKWPVVHADLRGLDLSAYEGVDLLAGGVPCQPYSSAGERRGAHDERDLFPEALRLVRQLRPKAVMLENVTGALHVSNSVNRLRILSQLTSLGYDAEWRILQGLDFGLPQKRLRAILVGFQPGIMHRFRWPRRLDTTAPTVGEALRDLMAAEGWPYVNEWAKGADGYALTLIGGSQKKEGIDLGQDKSRQSWLKLGVNPSGRAKTAPGPDTPVGYKPKLTLGMMARLQDFPGDWEFKGSDLQVFRQIANAFPPSMAHAIGASIMRALTGSEIDLAAALKVPRRVKPGRLNLAALRSRSLTENVDEMA